MAKNKMDIDFRGFSEYAEKLERLGASLQDIFTGAMEQVGRTYAEDTLSALEAQQLPAKGKYATGESKASVITAPTVKWSGSLAEMPVGFDKTKPGAGTWLITGTPKMRPAAKLNSMYTGQGYLRKRKNEIDQYFQSEIDKRMR